MKIKSVIIAFSTAVILTLTLAVQAFAAGTPFTDLANVGAKDKVIWLQDQGYVKGVADGRFAPNRPITGAESIQLLVNTFKLNLDTIRFIKEPKATDYFKKADNSAWYAQAMIIAAVRGIELPNDLDPNEAWTREFFTYQLIKSMQQYNDLPMTILIAFDISDEDKLTVDYIGAIQRALLYGVVKLDAEGKFNPKEKITRAEAAEQVYNVLQYLKAHPAPKTDS